MPSVVALPNPNEPKVAPAVLSYDGKGDETRNSLFEGDTSRGLNQHRFRKFDHDVGAFRPWREPGTGRVFVTLNADAEDKDQIQNVEVTHDPAYSNLVNNSPFYEGTLAFRDWFILDQAILRAARPALRVVADARAAGTEYTIPQGLGKTVLQYQRVSNISPATMSMDGMRESEADRPVFDLNNLPLPITHKDFDYGTRELMASRSGNNPLDTTTGELAARKVAESVEQLHLGLLPTFTYGGGSIYGMVNFPQRLTYSIMQPTTAGWTPQQTLDDILQMVLLSKLHYYYGPFILYHSIDFTPYMDDDFSQAKGDWTLRDRIEQVGDIQEVCESAWLYGFQLVLVMMDDPGVIRLVNGMDITTVQWMTHGGMQQKFKVMCIQVPQLRTDINGNTGIVHGS